MMSFVPKGWKAPGYKSVRTKDEPQQIVAQRLLSCLQYPVPYISRMQMIYAVLW